MLIEHNAFTHKYTHGSVYDVLISLFSYFTSLLQISCSCQHWTVAPLATAELKQIEADEFCINF
jgi:hypothetical protein